VEFWKKICALRDKKNKYSNSRVVRTYLSHGRPNFQLSWNFLIHVLGVFASGVTLVDAPLLLDEGFGLEEVSRTTLLEM
jgi:hypothetical protein